MIVVYPAIFYKEANVYRVEFPDLEGCFSKGDSMEEAIEHAKNILADYIASKLKANEQIEEPSKIQSINAGKGLVSYITANTLK